MYVFSSLENKKEKKRRISGGYVSKGTATTAVSALKWIAQSYGESRTSEREGVKSNVMNSRSVPSRKRISLPFFLFFSFFYPFRLLFPISLELVNRSLPPTPKPDLFESFTSRRWDEAPHVIGSLVCSGAATAGAPPVR